MGFEVIDITNYYPRQSDLFLFDTSIWMYLFCPLGNYRVYEQRSFSSFLEKARSSRSSIFMSSLVLSEFANAYLRLDFALWMKTENLKGAQYKRDFVGTDRYKKTLQLLIPTLKKIMSFCEKGSDNFSHLDIDKILSHFQSIDFNDSYYLELSKDNNFKIVTADYDFVKYKNHGLGIITIPRG